MALSTDLDDDGAYTTADLAIAATEATGTAMTDDAVVTNLMCYDATQKLYIELGTTCATYAAASDHTIVPASVTAPTTAPTVLDEAYTSNANFLWSDNSQTSHTTSTADWTNGYLVDDLSTSSLTLSY